MAFKNWLKVWEMLDQSSRTAGRRRPGENARRPLRLGIELLEDRTVPTVVFPATFGPEDTHRGDLSPLNNVGIYLLFQDGATADGKIESWQSPTYNALANSIISAAAQLFSPASHLRDGIRQYGVDGQASLAGWAFNSDISLQSGFGWVDAGRVITHDLGNDLTSIVNHAIDVNHTTDAPHWFPKPNETNNPIFVVLTPPGVYHNIDGNGRPTDAGDNLAGVYFDNNGDNSLGGDTHGLTSGHTGIYSDEWVGDPSAGKSDSLQTMLDEYTRVLSHETTEQIVSPFGPGLQYLVQLPNISLPFGLGSIDLSSLGASLYVTHGMNYPDEGKGSEQIGDLEPDDLGYYYRLGGVEVQAYWSYNDKSFIVPDGNSQVFNVVPQYHEKIDGVDQGISTSYNPDTTRLVGRTLVINGDQEAFDFFGVPLGSTTDVITVAPVIDIYGGDIGVLVTLNGETVQFASGDVTKDPNAIDSIVINPGAGTNYVYVQNAFSGIPVVINDTGTDTVIVGSNEQLFQMPAVTVNGAGDTRLILDDRNSSGGQTYTVTDKGVQSPEFAAPLTYRNVSDLTLLGGSFLGKGQNTFNVGDGSANLGALPAHLSILVPPSSDNSLVVYDGSQGPNPSLENVAYTISASNVTLTSSGFSQVTGSFSSTSSIDYSGITSLTVKGGANDGNTFHVGDGNHNLDYLPADVKIQGGNPGDALTVDDRGTADPSFPSVASDRPIFTITANSVSRVDQADAMVPPSTVAVTTYFRNSIDYNSIASLTVIGGDGHPNRFIVGDATHNLDYLPAHVRIQGGNQGDFLDVDDRGNSDPSFPLVLDDLSATLVVAAGNVSRTDQALVLFPLQPAPQVTTFSSSIDYSSITSLLVIGGNKHQNKLFVGDGKNPLTFLPAQLQIQGQGGGDTLTVDDSSQATPFGLATYAPSHTSFVVGSQQVTRTALMQRIGGPTTAPPTFSAVTTIAYSYLGGLTVLGGRLGAYDYDLESTAAGIPVTLSTGAGTNTVSVTPTKKRLGDLGSDVTINAPVSSKGTTVSIDNTNGASPPRGLTTLPPDQYVIGPTSTTFGDPITVNYTNVHAVTLHGGTTGSYIVQGVPAGGSYTLYPGAGPNHFSIVPGLRNFFLNGPITGDLTIDDSGDTANATYTITPTTVQVSGFPAIPYAGATSLTVKGGSGADTFNAQGTAAGVPVTLVTGAGTSLVNVSSRDGQLADIQGDLTIQGHGHTTAVLNDQGESLFALLGVPNIFTVTASAVTSRDTAATIHYSGLSGLTLNGDIGDDIYNVEGTAFGTPVTLNTGTGTNTVNVTPATQDMSQILGDLTIHGHGQTTAILNDQNDIIPVVEFLPSFYYVTDAAVQFDFFGEGTIHYSGLSGLILNADRLTDAFYDIESTAAGTPVTLNLGPNSNEVDVSPINKSLKNLKAGLVIQPASAGQTSVSLDDSSDAANAAYTITASTVRASGAAAVTYAGATGLTLKGGSGADTFSVQGTAATTPVALNTGAGSNTVTVAGQTQSLDATAGSLTVNAGAGPAALVVDDQATTGARTWTLTQGNLTATGAAGTNGAGAHIAFSKLASVTVNGGSGGNTFNVQGTDAGTAFALNTGAGNDTVNVGDTRNTFEEFLGTLTVKGQAGSDTLNLNDQGELDPATQGNNFGYHTEDDTWAPAANSLPAYVVFYHVPAGVLAQPGSGQFVTTSLYWQHMQQIVFTDPVGGSTAEHTFLPNALAGTHLTLHGGVLNDTLLSGAAAGQQQTFTITGQNAGTVGNVSFTGESYLLSFGAGQAKFKFLPGGSMGALNGDGSPAILDLSALTTPTTVNLPYFSGGLYNWGSVPGVIQVFASMTSVVGASGDTLVGGNTANTWSVTGKNAGQVTGVTFSGFSNLTGGSQADTFAFVTGGSVTGAVNGGDGVNALDYSGYTGDISVDLPLGTAKLVGAGVQNIQNVVGSVGNDILVGNGTGNTLTGGTGRNLLIAGGGPGQLLGGPDDDILVGGKTAYDSNPTALAALLLEWTRTDLPYGARVDHLLHGGGKNGTTKLNVPSFTANAGGNTLTGAGGLDLFYGSPSRDANDWTPSIGEVFVGQDGVHASTQVTVAGLSVSAVLDGTVTLAANSSQRLTLTPGNHTIADPRCGASVTFGVSDSGTVSYAAALEGALTGAGTSTLTVNGRTITIDATALSLPRLLLDNTLALTNAAPFAFTLLPGKYQVADATGAPAGLSFILNPNGTDSYDQALEGVLTGAGTGTLTVRGVTVTIEATALSVQALVLDNSLAVPTAAPFVFTGLPGNYTLVAPASATAIVFTIESNGTIDYDPRFDNFLSGRGTSRLVIHGLPG